MFIGVVVGDNVWSDVLCYFFVYLFCYFFYYMLVGWFGVIEEMGDCKFYDCVEDYGVVVSCVFFVVGKCF